MHIKKNCDLIGLLLNIEGKMKGTINALVGSTRFKYKKGFTPNRSQ